MAVKLHLHTLGGLPVPSFVTQENLDQLKDFQLYSDDVWVVTYPKCGTTWTQQIVKLIRSNGVQDETKVTQSVPWLESLQKLSKLGVSRPRAFKSHFPYHQFPCGAPNMTPCKFIYVARNPKDVAVSLYFHTKSGCFPDINWVTYWEKFVSGELEFGDYFDHLLSWWPHTDDKNVLFLKYEDMKKDLPHAVSRIALFIEADISDDVIAKIADMTTFDNMKKDPCANYSWHPANRDFLRKGVVGDWKNFLTVEQSAQIDALCVDRFEGTGLVFEYE